jgi:hypothetical protein
MAPAAAGKWTPGRRMAMKFIVLNVRTASIVHGFDADNREIVEVVARLSAADLLV